MNAMIDPPTLAPERVLLLMPTHSYRAGAFVQAAETLGLPVAIGSPMEHVLAQQNPGTHLTVDFQDLEASTDKIVDFAQQYPLKAVISPDDDAALLAAMASDALKLTNNRVSAVAAARNKYLMRAALADAGLPSPWFKRFSIDQAPKKIASQIPFPCVIKPLSLSASRGVIRANNQAEFVTAFHRVASLLQRPEIAAQEGIWANHILVESYIPGFEVALEGLLTAGELNVLAVFDKPDSLEGPYFEETIYVTPSLHPPTVQKALFARTAEAAAALDIQHGPIHAELRVNEKGAWVVEIAPRSIGGYCSQALRFADGLSLEGLILEHAQGKDVTTIQRERTASGVMMIPIPHAGILEGVRGLQDAESIPGVKKIILAIPMGKRVTPLPEGNQYLGFIFARSETPTAVENILREAHARLDFDIQVHE